MSKADDAILEEARKRFNAGIEADRDNRLADEEDRRFLSGEQYPSDVRELRKNRPCEVFNRLPQFVKQVTGEMRQNKPAIRVLPVDDKTDPKLAEVYAAIIRHIESKSDANRVYVRAGESAVQGGIGYFRLTADYTDTGSFDQELCVKRIRNPLSVVFDPEAQGLVREDANWAFISELMREDDFKAQFPKAKLGDFNPTSSDFTNWRYKEDKCVRVAEYWRRVPVFKTLARMADGSVHDVSKVEGAEVGAILQLPDGTQQEIAAIRKAKSYRVQWFLLNGSEILERGEWKGTWIPIFPVLGEEVEVGERTVRHGIVRFAKGPQRSYNYFRNAAIEHIALQPKAPYLATAEQITPYKAMWDKLNTSNAPYLLYKPDPLAPNLAPRRSEPPTMPAAMYQEAQVADADMKAVTGIYDASLGNKSNETSGVAIRARQAEGDTVTFAYIDNLVAAIKHCGRCLIELIPHYYDGERVIRMMGEDDSVKGYVAVNKMLPGGRVWNDLSQGTYDVEVSTGPAFATKRAEAADRLLSLTQSVPAIGQIGGDIIVKSLDVPYADELSDRLARMLPPGIDPEGQAKRQQEEPQQQPDPAQVEAMEMQRMLAILALRKAEAETLEAEANAEKARAEAALKGVGVARDSYDLGVQMGSGPQQDSQEGDSQPGL